MRVALIAALLVPLAATVVVAQTDLITARKALMKDIGDQTKVAGAMVKGDLPYDAAKAAVIFKSYTDGSAKFGALFPAGTENGDTKAAPAIWTDRAGFDAALAKFKADIAANVGSIGTEAGFKTAMAAVGDNCRTCHQTYKLR